MYGRNFVVIINNKHAAIQGVYCCILTSCVYRMLNLREMSTHFVEDRSMKKTVQRSEEAMVPSEYGDWNRKDLCGQK